MTGYINEFNENKNKSKDKITMSLKFKDKQLFKNYNKIWKIIEKLMSIDFDSKPTYADDDKYIKTKIKTYKDTITTNFHNKKIPIKEIPYKCFSIIISGSVLYAYEKYHPQTFLEECKYAQEQIKAKNYIDEELKSESDTDSDNDIDIDIDNEE